MLVVNTHYRPRLDDPYLRRLRALRLPNVRIGPGALPPADYERMIASADIGLALYCPSGIPPFGGRNIVTMGLSSGKLASYVRAGVPVVTTGNPELAALMERYAFGACADCTGDVPSLLEAVRGNREELARGARKFFLEQLDFGRFWPPVWERLASASGAGLASPIAANDGPPIEPPCPLGAQAGAQDLPVEAYNPGRGPRREA